MYQSGLLFTIICLFSYFASGQSFFTEITNNAGLCPNGTCSDFSGGTLTDYDLDGNIDIIIARRLYHNNGGTTAGFTWTKVNINGTVANNLPAGSSFIWIDFDNDGDLDLCIGRKWGGANKMLRLDSINNNQPYFTDITATTGIPTDIPASYAWGDYDKDGDLDFYFFTYESTNNLNAPDYTYHPDRLYRNDLKTTGKFTDVTATAGMSNQQAKNKDNPPQPNGRPASAAMWCDYDNDGDVDLFVTNYRREDNILWRNNGNGTFTNVSGNFPGKLNNGGPAIENAHTTGFEWVDYDNDGDFDIFITNLKHGWTGHHVVNFSRLFRNDNGSFTDVTSTQKNYPADIYKEYQDICPAFLDYDNDGDLDLYVSGSAGGGGTYKYTDDKQMYHTTFFTNSGSGGGYKLIRVTKTTDPTIEIEDGNGVAAADIDNDGYMDILLGSGGWKAWDAPSGWDPKTTLGKLLKNNKRGSSGKHWVKIRLKGTTTNSLGVGSSIHIPLGKEMLSRLVTAGSNGQSNAVTTYTQHFGLNTTTTVKQVLVNWANSHKDSVELFSNLKADQLHILEQGKGVMVHKNNTTADAGIATILYPVTVVDCSAKVTPQITLKNFGSGNLTSATIKYRFDNEPLKSKAWSGTLGPGQTTNFGLPSAQLTAGNHTFEAYTVNPNGIPDNNPANDKATSSFKAECYKLDARVTVISKPADTLESCDLVAVSPVVIIKNLGMDTLLNATINLRVNKDSIFTTQWQGSLATNATESVSLNDILVKSGTYMLEAYTGQPNGATDERPANDTTSKSVTVRCNNNIEANEVTTPVIYPNPAREELTIRLPQKSSVDDLKILMYDPTGRKIDVIWNFVDHYVKMDIGTYPTGLYVVHVLARDFSYIERVVLSD